jgi:CBS domain-containing protein
MPYSVERLIEDQGSAIVVQKTDAITSVLDLMIEHDFSQLPVVDDNQTLLGMVTYESILRAARSFNIKLNELFVRDAMVNAPFHYCEDDLFDLLDELKVTNAVVIIEPGGRVLGVVTNYDASEFLRSRTEDLMHVEDVEFIIKELIKRVFIDEKGVLNMDRLQTAIGKSHTPRGEQADPKKAKAFEELNLGDYINLLVSKDIWNFCAPILSVQKESLYELLVKIRQTRNDLAHFRSEISPRSRDELKYCANWLRGRYQDYEKEQGVNFIDTLLQRQEENETVHVTHEESVAYNPAIEPDEKSRERKATRYSRYAALAYWLAEQTAEQVSLTFEQIEGIMNSPLPSSALQLRAWWANDRVSHAPSLLWLEAGWKVAYVDLGERQVVFDKIKPLEDA